VPILWNQPREHRLAEDRERFQHDHKPPGLEADAERIDHSTTRRPADQATGSAIRSSSAQLRHWGVGNGASLRQSPAYPFRRAERSMQTRHPVLSDQVPRRRPGGRPSIVADRFPDIVGGVRGWSTSQSRHQSGRSACAIQHFSLDAATIAELTLQDLSDRRCLERPSV